jgi:hypothetical protein
VKKVIFVSKTIYPAIPTGDAGLVNTPPIELRSTPREKPLPEEPLDCFTSLGTLSKKLAVLLQRLDGYVEAKNLKQFKENAAYVPFPPDLDLDPEPEPYSCQLTVGRIFISLLEQWQKLFEYIPGAFRYFFPDLFLACSAAYLIHCI